MGKTLDKGGFERQTVTVGGQAVSIEPESLQQFDHKGEIRLVGIRPHKKKPHPDAKPDDLVLHMCVNAELDLSVEQAKEVFGEYTISALCARAGDIASPIKFSGRIGSMRVRLFDNSYDLEAVDFENISFTILRKREIDAPSYWYIRMKFKFSFIPPNANAFSVISEYICEPVAFECMPMNGSFDFDDAEWQELATRDASPVPKDEDTSQDTADTSKSDNQDLPLESE